MQELFIPKKLVEMGLDYINTTTGIAWKLIPLLYLVNVMVALTKAEILEDNRNLVVLKSVVNLMKVVVFLKFYVIFFDMVNRNLILPLCQSIMNNDAYQRALNATWNSDSEIYTLLNPFSYFFGWIVKTIAIYGLSVAMRTVAAISLLIMLILGPFAIVFSLLPSFSSNLSFWFKTTFTILFWQVTITLIDSFFVVCHQSNISTVWLYIVFLAFYLKVPGLTSIFMNSIASANPLNGLMSTVAMLGSFAYSTVKTNKK